MHRSILASTGNPGKLREIIRVLEGLDVRVDSLKDYGHIEEPEENGSSFAENARLKALYYAEKTGKWCLADDSGLVVDALGGLPGVHSARFAIDDCSPDAGRDVIDMANNRKLIKLLEDVPDKKRTARFVCCLALAEPGKILLETTGTIEGLITHTPSGNNGFGYDPFFFLPDRNCTTAELPPDDKNSISHRGKALMVFATRLQELLSKD